MENLKIHNKLKGLLLITLVIIFMSSCLVFYDIYIDLKVGVDKIHIYHELRNFIPLVTAILVVGVLYYKLETKIYDNLKSKDFEILDLNEKFHRLQNLNEILSKALIKKISLQFEIWELTKTEKEIGLLLIKGYSSKEIGMLRQNSEKTIRGQASSIYNKAGLRNRSELTSYFIEDIL